jgi:hypothetical protein
MSEATLQGLAGGIQGCLGGIASWRSLGSMNIDMPAASAPVLLPFATALGLAVAVAGTLRPLIGVLREPPALVLGGSLGRGWVPRRSRA